MKNVSHEHTRKKKDVPYHREDAALCGGAILGAVRFEVLNCLEARCGCGKMSASDHWESMILGSLTSCAGEGCNAIDVELAALGSPASRAKVGSLALERSGGGESREGSEGESGEVHCDGVCGGGGCGVVDLLVI